MLKVEFESFEKMMTIMRDPKEITITLTDQGGLEKEYKISFTLFTLDIVQIEEEEDDIEISEFEPPLEHIVSANITSINSLGEVVITFSTPMKT